MSSTYEEERLARIKQNAERLQSLQVRELADSLAAQQDADAKATVKARKEALGLHAPGTAPRQRSTRAAKPAPSQRKGKRPAVSRDDNDREDDGSERADSAGSVSRSSMSYDPLADDEARTEDEEEEEEGEEEEEQDSGGSGAEAASSEDGKAVADGDDRHAPAGAGQSGDAEGWHAAHPELAARADDPHVQAMAQACGMDVESFLEEQLAAGFEATQQQGGEQQGVPAERSRGVKMSKKQPSQQISPAAGGSATGTGAIPAETPSTAKRKRAAPATKGVGSTGRGRKKEPAPSLPEIAAGFRLLQPDGGRRLRKSSIIQAASALGEKLDRAMLDDMISRAAELVEMEGDRLTLKSFQELVMFYYD